MLKNIVLISFMLCAGACTAYDGRQKIGVAQCFVVNESPNGALSGALKRASNRLGLQIELSNPDYLLLRNRAGAPRVLLLYAPRDIGTLLVSYDGGAQDFIDLRTIKELDGLNATFKLCPATGSDFSPPTIYD